MAVQTTYDSDRAIAFEGMLGDANVQNVRGMINKDAASVPFGHAVAFEGSSDNACDLPAAGADIIAGIAVHSHNHPQSDLDATGLITDADVDVLREGTVWAICADGCSPGDPLFVRWQGGTLGELNAADDPGNTLDLTGKGQWLTTATAGNLALLALDMNS